MPRPAGPAGTAAHRGGGDAVATRARLNRDRVLAAAVALADREGAEALTVRRLADALGVHPTSLYNHVSSKAAVLDGVIERLFNEVALPPQDTTWQEWLRTLARVLREMARRHPGAFLVLTRRPVQAPLVLDQTEVALEAFRRGGFTTAAAVHAIQGSSLALLGLALNECMTRQDGVDLSDDRALAGHPRLRAAAAEVGPGDEDGHWDVVVEALVAGLEQAAARPR